MLPASYLVPAHAVGTKTTKSQLRVAPIACVSNWYDVTLDRYIYEVPTLCWDRPRSAMELERWIVLRAMDLRTFTGISRDTRLRPSGLLSLEFSIGRKGIPVSLGLHIVRISS